MVRKRSERLERLMNELDSIVERTREFEERYATQLELLHPEQVESGRNLLHYLALRHSDIRDLQGELASLGLSSLGRCESHVLSSIRAVQDAVQHLLGADRDLPPAPLTREEGHARIRRRTDSLFGRKRRGSSVRIMVTMPAEAADDYGMVLDMVKSGMNCARINCSAGTPAEWERMVSHVHRARAVTGRSCRIFMDLAGPKIRTGELVPGPEIARLEPDRDPRGRPAAPAVVELVPDDDSGAAPSKKRLPVTRAVFDALAPGRTVVATDTRGHEVTMTVESVGDGSARVCCWEDAWLETGLSVTVREGNGPPLGSGTLGQLPGDRPFIRLSVGDTLIVHKEPRPGEGAIPSPDGGALVPAHVAIQVPELLDHLEVGQDVVLDDGKFRGTITEVRSDEIVVVITHAPPGGAKLRGSKGINFPGANTGLFGLTDKDREDLPFVVEHADAVNVSFVNHPDDVEDLLDELEAMGGQDLGLVLKIETLMGVRNLPGILLAAMEWPAVGVMIARGDLAVEVGWTELAKAQEEILWLCEASHFPVIWATEVLNQLAKKGTPTRGEISDVVMAERAECVMLNKGPHITTAIRTLDDILASMQDYQMKKTALLPALPLLPPDPTEVGRTVGKRMGRWEEARPA